MSNKPDFQKESATQSLWDLDGHHAPKKYRRKGKGRWKDKTLTQQMKDEADLALFLDASDDHRAEEQAAWDCYMFGPCEMCKGLEDDT